MRHRVLVTRRLPGAALARLGSGCDVDLNELDRPLTRDELMSRVRGAAALLSLLTDRVDGEVMDAGAPGLRIVANYAVGYDNVDVAAATDRGIPVTNTPDVLTDATADLAWALILATVRRVAEGDRAMRAGAFPGWSPLYMLGGEATGATLGIFGFGRIGRAVARRACGFGMRVVYNSRTPAAPDVERELGAEFVPFEGLLAAADILTIHAPLTGATRRRFGAAEFRRMKPTAHLVNTARGGIVDEAALAEALAGGVLAGAGLDVHEDEPRACPALLACPNAVLAPHLGSATVATRARMADCAVDNILAVLSGKSPVTCVNPSVLERRQ